MYTHIQSEILLKLADFVDIVIVLPCSVITTVKDEFSSKSRFGKNGKSSNRVFNGVVIKFKHYSKIVCECITLNANIASDGQVVDVPAFLRVLRDT